MSPGRVRGALSFSADDRPGSTEALKQKLQDFVRDGADFPVVHFAAGETIIQQDASGDSAYVIEAGRCEVRRVVDGASRTIRVMGPGEGFGETAILTDSVRSATVVALEPCTLRRIRRDRIEAELAGMRPWMSAFMRTLAMRFREL